MMKALKWAGFVAAGLVVTAGQAAAQGYGPSHLDSTIAEEFRNLDFDGNGKLDLKELSTRLAAPIAPEISNPLQSKVQQMVQRAADLIGEYDRNSDGVLHYREYRKFSLKRHDMLARYGKHLSDPSVSRYAQSDYNLDGLIGAQEMTQLRGRGNPYSHQDVRDASRELYNYDLNRDGYLDSYEAIAPFSGPYQVNRK